MNFLLFLFSLILFASGLFLVTKAESAFLLDGKPILPSIRSQAKRMFLRYGLFFLLLSLITLVLLFRRQDTVLLLLLLAAAIGAALFSWRLYRLMRTVLHGKDDLTQ